MNHTSCECYMDVIYIRGYTGSPRRDRSCQRAGNVVNVFTRTAYTAGRGARTYMGARNKCPHPARVSRGGVSWAQTYGTCAVLAETAACDTMTRHDTHTAILMVASTAAGMVPPPTTPPPASTSHTFIPPIIFPRPHFREF